MGRRLQLAAGTLMAAACAARIATRPAGERAGRPTYADAVVAADGSGQFQSLQAAILAAPTATRERPWVIYVKAGTYRERLYVQREKRFLALVGEDASKTIVTFDLHAFLPGPDGRPISTFRTPTAQIDADDFTAENLTFENPAGTEGRQALAVRVDGERVAFRGCRFVGWQDTILLARGRQYLEDCFVSGSVDFIFGGATAFFERCSIHARGDGYVTAASTPQEQDHGFVFRGCRITGEPGVRTFLGRPWRAFASVAFLDTEMSEVVRPEGWHNWDRPLREKTVRYGERGTTGPGAAEDARVAWARRFTVEEERRLTVENVLGGADGWRPAAEGSDRRPGAGRSSRGASGRECAAVPRAGALHPGRGVRAPSGRRVAAARCLRPAGPRALRGHDPRARRGLVGRGPDEGRGPPPRAADPGRCGVAVGRLPPRAEAPLPRAGRGRGGGRPLGASRTRGDFGSTRSGSRWWGSRPAGTSSPPPPCARRRACGSPPSCRSSRRWTSRPTPSAAAVSARRSRACSVGPSWTRRPARSCGRPRRSGTSARGCRPSSSSTAART